MVRSIISMLAVAGLLLFAAADAEAGKPRRHGSICDEAGLIGSAYGACNAYCEALDCDSLEPGGSKRACEQARNRFMKLTGELPPCEPLCPCGSSWRHENFLDASVFVAECLSGEDEISEFADLWVTDEVTGEVLGASLYMSDDPMGGLNSVGCYALQDPDDPDNPLGGEFMMLNSFSEESIRFNVQKKRIFRACQAEFAQLIEKLGIECVSMD